ncbi:ABC transporter ATP-binding protein [Desulforhopalus sp. IMCC35007]|uniref:ABC transporter ATP-binding protein n=1 Tax=Desulforhopalus sp. IMCC35007 TaxID=2569543 RepID=UPI0010AEBA41|nr:ABC transporter ATP-binding protein [Desulforhopalus sp. IMCC35007]TKB09384.1 ABC transporter ATP-binding protein [Desulforhopalus sp. IMCC35007]
MSTAAISISGVSKTYRTGFWGKKFVALDALSLSVEKGEILGYLGPNGAGKTTTFKVLLDLIRPDSGTLSIFGDPADQKARERVGYLPENPYFYMYLTAEETLHFHGRLRGMKGEARKKRIPELLHLVGLEHAKSRSLKKFSRGMLQRIGIAQALVNNPDILILDEPMSGLDPNGRKQMRDIILGCRDQGKTVIFSSHILSDVEIMCDRAAIIRQGKLQEIVQVSEMLDNKVAHWEITCSSLPENSPYEDCIVHKTKNQILLKTNGEVEAKKMIQKIEESGGRVLSFGPQRVNLEEFYNQSGKEEK